MRLFTFVFFIFEMFGIIAFAQPAAPAVRLAPLPSSTDLVWIAKGRFYIQIFENTNQEVSREIADWHPAPASAGANQPALVSPQIAEWYCQRLGMRLPSVDEWKAAASDSGKQILFSLQGGRLYSNQGEPLGNFGAVSYTTIQPSDPRVGIDAAGTMGLTGNALEWATRSEGSDATGFSFCGGDVRTSDIAYLRIDQNICGETFLTRHGSIEQVMHPANGDRRSSFSSAYTRRPIPGAAGDLVAGIRCARNSFGNEHIHLSSRVPASLRTKIETEGRLSSQGLIDRIQHVLSPAPVRAGASGGASQQSSDVEIEGLIRVAPRQGH